MNKVVRLFILFVLSACKGDVVNEMGNHGDVEISIWNSTEYNFTDLYVNTNGGENDYGNLSKGNKSGYKKFVSAYRYAFISFKIDKDAIAIQPTDYVGEEQIQKGKYTYKIVSVDLKGRYATMEFIKE